MLRRCVRHERVWRLAVLSAALAARAVVAAEAPFPSPAPSLQQRIPRAEGAHISVNFAPTSSVIHDVQIPQKTGWDKFWASGYVARVRAKPPPDAFQMAETFRAGLPMSRGIPLYSIGPGLPLWSQRGIDLRAGPISFLQMNFVSYGELAGHRIFFQGALWGLRVRPLSWGRWEMRAGAANVPQGYKDGRKTWSRTVTMIGLGTRM